MDFFEALKAGKVGIGAASDHWTRLFSQKMLAGVQYGEASGAIASFTTRRAAPIAELTANIVPIQSGTGDPSPTNIRPISGWTGANVHVADGADPHVVDNVYAISWQTEAGTVYGGTLDVVRGVLSVDGKLITLTGAETVYSNNGTSGGKKHFYIQYGSTAIYRDSTGTGVSDVCSHFEICNILPSNTSVGAMMVFSRERMSLRMRPENVDSMSDTQFSSWLSEQYANGTPVQFKATLATPITYQLTPTEVTTLLGQNNVWADTGDVYVKYIKN